MHTDSKELWVPFFTACFWNKNTNTNFLWATCHHEGMCSKNNTVIISKKQHEVVRFWKKTNHMRDSAHRDLQGWLGSWSSVLGPKSKVFDHQSWKYGPWWVLSRVSIRYLFILISFVWLNSCALFLDQAFDSCSTQISTEQHVRLSPVPSGWWLWRSLWVEAGKFSWLRLEDWIWKISFSTCCFHL